MSFGRDDKDRTTTTGGGSAAGGPLRDEAKVTKAEQARFQYYKAQRFNKQQIQKAEALYKLREEEAKRQQQLRKINARHTTTTTTTTTAVATEQQQAPRSTCALLGQLHAHCNQANAAAQKAGEAYEAKVAELQKTNECVRLIREDLERTQAQLTQASQSHLTSDSRVTHTQATQKTSRLREATDAKSDHLNAMEAAAKRLNKDLNALFHTIRLLEDKAGLLKKQHTLLSEVSDFDLRKQLLAIFNFIHILQANLTTTLSDDGTQNQTKKMAKEDFNLFFWQAINNHITIKHADDRKIAEFFDCLVERVDSLIKTKHPDSTLSDKKINLFKHIAEVVKTLSIYMQALLELDAKQIAPGTLKQKLTSIQLKLESEQHGLEPRLEAITAHIRSIELESEQHGLEPRLEAITAHIRSIESEIDELNSSKDNESLEDSTLNRISELESSIESYQSEISAMLEVHQTNIQATAVAHNLASCLTQYEQATKQTENKLVSAGQHLSATVKSQTTWPAPLHNAWVKFDKNTDKALIELPGELLSSTKWIIDDLRTHNARYKANNPCVLKRANDNRAGFEAKSQALGQCSAHLQAIRARIEENRVAREAAAEELRRTAIQVENEQQAAAASASDHRERYLPIATEAAERGAARATAQERARADAARADAARQSTDSKKSFWQRHRKKILVGAAIGLGVGLGVAVGIAVLATPVGWVGLAAAGLGISAAAASAVVGGGLAITGLAIGAAVFSAGTAISCKVADAVQSRRRAKQQQRTAAFHDAAAAAPNAGAAGTVITADIAARDTATTTTCSTSPPAENNIASSSPLNSTTLIIESTTIAPHRHEGDDTSASTGGDNNDDAHDGKQKAAPISPRARTNSDSTLVHNNKNSKPRSASDPAHLQPPTDDFDSFSGLDEALANAKDIITEHYQPTTRGRASTTPPSAAVTTTTTSPIAAPTATRGRHRATTFTGKPHTDNHRAKRRRPRQRIAKIS